MEDIYLKYGLLIVGLGAIAMLLVFAGGAFKKTKLIPEETEQSFSGSNETFASLLIKLCDSCISKKNYNRECYLIHASITSGTFETVNRVIGPGNHVLKVYSEGNACKVKKVG